MGGHKDRTTSSRTPREDRKASKHPMWSMSNLESLGPLGVLPVFLLLLLLLLLPFFFFLSHRESFLSRGQSLASRQTRLPSDGEKGSPFMCSRSLRTSFLHSRTPSPADIDNLLHPWPQPVVRGICHCCGKMTTG